MKYHAPENKDQTLVYTQALGTITMGIVATDNMGQGIAATDNMGQGIVATDNMDQGIGSY